MRVLTVYAHPNPASFCHAILERFTEGLGYLQRAYRLGHEFESTRASGRQLTPEPETVEGGVR